MNKTMLLAADADAPFEPMPTTPAIAPDATTKACPVCHAQTFVDMDTCYNCMYMFGSDPALEERRQAMDVHPSTGMRADMSLAGNASSGPSDANMRTGCTHQADPCAPRMSANDQLFAELLVELRGFLGKFLLDRGVDIKQL